MQIKNGAELLRPKVAFAQTSVTAGGTGDDTKITGEKIDRLNYQSCFLVLQSNASIADTETLSYAVEIQDSDDDGATWKTATVLKASAVVFTASGATTNVVTLVGLSIGLAGYGQHVRFNPTPDLSAANTDTATINGSVTLTDGVNTPEQLAFLAIEKD